MYRYLPVKVVLFLSLVLNLFVGARCHARLWEPPSRSSMWRRGYNTTVNINDNELSCGGYMNQWVLYGGLCGVCGDPYQQIPRDNEAGGKYASGIITRGYLQGSVIDVLVDLTANHGGHFEFKICPNNNPAVRATPACFVQHRLTVVGANGTGNRYILKDRDTHGLIPVQVKLPEGLTCFQCVLQWSYITASRWNCDDGLLCQKGVGPQEHFYGCSDIAIFNAEDFRSNPIPKPKEDDNLPPRVFAVPSHTNHMVRRHHYRVAHALKSKFNPYIDTVPQIYRALQSEVTFTLKRPVDLVSSFFQKLVLDAVGLFFQRFRKHFNVTAENCVPSEVHLSTPGLNEWCTITCADGLPKCPLRMCYCTFIVTTQTSSSNAIHSDGASNETTPIGNINSITNTQVRGGSDPTHSQKSEREDTDKPHTKAMGGFLFKHHHKTQQPIRNHITQQPSLPKVDNHEAIGNSLLTIFGGEGGAVDDHVETAKLVPPSKLICTASLTFRTNPKMNNWCMKNCGFGFCPSTVCVCK